MTVKELEEYQVICRKGSLNKAAKELFMTPQGLGRMLKNLEEELECTLMNRGASGLELTESGRYLLEYARQMTSDYENLKEKIESLQDNDCGSIDLLMAYDMIRIFDPECFRDFRKHYPSIALSYREYPAKVTEQMLLEGKGTAAISVGPFGTESFYGQPLLSCPLSMVAYEEHPLCAKTEITVADLNEEPLFLENNSFKIQEFVQDRCWTRGFEPNIVYEASGFDICCKMVRMKKGITILPDIIYQDMKTDGLVRIPFADARMELEIALLSPKGSPNAHGADKLYHFLKSRQKESWF